MSTFDCPLCRRSSRAVVEGAIFAFEALVWGGVGYLRATYIDHCIETQLHNSNSRGAPHPAPSSMHSLARNLRERACGLNGAQRMREPYAKQAPSTPITLFGWRAEGARCWRVLVLSTRKHCIYPQAEPPSPPLPLQRKMRPPSMQTLHTAQVEMVVVE